MKSRNRHEPRTLRIHEGQHAITCACNWTSRPSNHLAEAQAEYEIHVLISERAAKKRPGKR